MPAGILYLDGPRLRRCLQAGLQQLISERDYLNRINVFPVPDGDTGNNLTHTARASLQALLADPQSGAGATLRIIANAALDGAQGNSGVILAQYLQVLAAATEGQERLLTGDLNKVLSIAARQTRAALAQPRDGTILTIMDATAVAAVTHASLQDFAQLVPHLVTAAENALSHTTEQLDALRKANVVDAGAHGFCAILQGFNTYLQNGSIRELAPAPADDVLGVLQHGNTEEDPTFRYCTEVLLAGENLRSDAIRSRLEKFGDSIVIAGSTQRVRIHIHTDAPETVFELAGNWGEVITTKAEDMQLQTWALRKTDRRIAIVTDSGADIPRAVMAELGIHMVPLRIQLGNESYLDKTGLSANELCHLLEATVGSATTSQPTPGDLRRMYEFLATHFEEIISIHLSNQLSGTVAGARSSSAMCADKTTILDCRTASVGQGLIVFRAAELAAEGMGRVAITAALEPVIAATRSFALVPNLAAGVRSGRLKPWIKTVADLLRVTPILAATPDGRITAKSFLPGRHNLDQRFARRISNYLDNTVAWRIAIGHGPHNAAQAEMLAGTLLNLLPNSELIWQTELGAALGLHAGMDALVVAFQPL